MSRMFGTDGVRGVAGMELTIELAMKLGQAGAYVLTKEQEHQPTIIVGCDTRISGGMLANAMMAGICSVGANAIYAGVVPTPAIAYLTRKHKVDAGVVISASHNPMEFNGIKFFNGAGYKLSDQLEDEIEALIVNNMKDVPIPTGSGIGRIEYRLDIKNEYIAFMKKEFMENMKNYRFFILFAVFLIFGIMSAPLAKFTPEILLQSMYIRMEPISIQTAALHIWKSFGHALYMKRQILELRLTEMQTV